MTEFNNMTIVAALQIIEKRHSHDKLALLELEWGIQGRCRDTSKAARIGDIAAIVMDENPQVITPEGAMSLDRALIIKALEAPTSDRQGPFWNKLVAGLRFDGFEIVEGLPETIPGDFYRSAEERIPLQIQRMLPNDLPEADFREAADEIDTLLSKHKFDVAKGHLAQAVSAFQRGEWASANAQMRSFFESYLNEIADKLGYHDSGNTDEKRAFLGQLKPPFLLEDYNEWHLNRQKPQYIQGLWSRMHPEGSHPGLSEEEDATFRLQITLITARLFLRRYDKRENI